jgi:hypothetical protein
MKTETNAGKTFSLDGAQTAHVWKDWAKHLTCPQPALILTNAIAVTYAAHRC